MLRLILPCLALVLGLAACASAPPPGLDTRLENPALITAPESPVPRYRTTLDATMPTKMARSAAEGADSEPAMTAGHSMAGMNHAAAGEALAVTLYACPMHPEKHYSEPGECPICGMTLELVEQEMEGHP